MPPKVNKAKAAAGKKGGAKKNGYQMPEPIPLGTILTDISKNNWKIGPSIGIGGFGEIYSACKANATPKKIDDYPFVVKIEPHVNGPLFVEMHFYMRNAKLEDIESFRKAKNLKSLGMPHFIGSGSQEINEIRHRFIVMPRFGRDVLHYFNENGKKIPIHTIYRLSLQMIDIFEYIHKCTYVHGDLKGANILLGIGKNGGAQAYLVDFGLASHYTTSPEYKPDPKKKHNGTIQYTSRDAHHGVPTMRGDLEILAYNLVNWFGEDLPWETSKVLGSPEKVQEQKEMFMKNVEISLKKCFTNCPDVLIEFFKYVATLKYNDQPDYNKCRKIFENGLKIMKKSNSGDLEFKISKTATTVTSSPLAKKIAKKVIKRSSSTDDEDDNDSVPQNMDSDSSQRQIKKKPKITLKPQTNTVPIKVEKTREKNIKTEKKDKGSKVTSSSSTTTSVSKANKKSDKTYQFNFELDLSVDANVVINVKRKGRNSTTQMEIPMNKGSLQSNTKTPENKKKKPNLNGQSYVIDDDDDDDDDDCVIPASPNTPVANMRVYKRPLTSSIKKTVTSTSTPTRKSPRS